MCVYVRESPLSCSCCIWRVNKSDDNNFLQLLYSIEFRAKLMTPSSAKNINLKKKRDWTWSSVYFMGFAEINVESEPTKQMIHTYKLWTNQRASGFRSRNESFFVDSEKTENTFFEKCNQATMATEECFLKHWGHRAIYCLLFSRRRRRLNNIHGREKNDSTCYILSRVSVKYYNGEAPAAMLSLFFTILCFSYCRHILAIS